jgi:uncharacterized membrane protein
MGRELNILDRHLRHWRERGLLDAAAEAGLRRASEDLEQATTGGVVRAGLALLGGALVLSGSILVIAENWAGLHRGLKLAGWAALLVGFLFGSRHLGRRFPDRPALAEALALLAGGWVLAGIALVGQIYHLAARPANAAWLWLVLIAPAAWLLGRRASSVLAFAALTAALALEVVEPDSWVRATRVDGPWLWLAIPLLAGAAVSLLPQPIPQLRSWLGLWVFAAGQFFLLVFGAIQELDRSSLGPAWVVAGAGIGIALGLPGRVFPASWDALTSRLALVAMLLPWVLVGRRYEGGVILDHLGVGLAWVVQLGVAALVIRAGARAGSRIWINLGYVALLAGVVVRYFDFFGDFLEGGLALALSGTLLLVVLYGLEKSRRRTFLAEARS